MLVSFEASTSSSTVTRSPHYCLFLLVSSVRGEILGWRLARNMFLVLSSSLDALQAKFRHKYANERLGNRPRPGALLKELYYYRTVYASHHQTISSYLSRSKYTRVHILYNSLSSPSSIPNSKLASRHSQPELAPGSGPPTFPSVSQQTSSAS